MIILKNFKKPDNLNEAQLALSKSHNISFLIDEDGKDWYESQSGFSEDTLKITFDVEGVIYAICRDISGLWPEGLSIAELAITDVPDGADISGGWIFDGDKIVTRTYSKSELMLQAVAKRDELASVANSKVIPLQDAVDLGDATDDELVMLKAWKKYRVDLNRLDLSSTPNIQWPDLPVNSI